MGIDHLTAPEGNPSEIVLDIARMKEQLATSSSSPPSQAAQVATESFLKSAYPDKYDGGSEETGDFADVALASGFYVSYRVPVTGDAMVDSVDQLLYDLVSNDPTDGEGSATGRSRQLWMSDWNRVFLTPLQLGNTVVSTYCLQPLGALLEGGENGREDETDLEDPPPPPAPQSDPPQPVASQGYPMSVDVSSEDSSGRPVRVHWPSWFVVGNRVESRFWGGSYGRLAKRAMDNSWVVRWEDVDEDWADTTVTKEDVDDYQLVDSGGQVLIQPSISSTIPSVIQFPSHSSSSVSSQSFSQLPSHSSSSVSSQSFSQLPRLPSNYFSSQSPGANSSQPLGEESGSSSPPSSGSSSWAESTND